MDAASVLPMMTASVSAVPLRSGDWLGAYLSGPLESDALAMLVAVSRFHVQNRVMRCRNAEALMVGQSMLFIVMLLMHPVVGLIPMSPATDALRLVILPLVIYAVLPLALYLGSMASRILSVCTVVLSFLTVDLVVVALAQLRVQTLGLALSGGYGFRPSVTSILEVVSGVHILPGLLQYDAGCVLGAAVIEIGLVMMIDVSVRMRIRWQRREWRVYGRRSGDRYEEFFCNDRFLGFSVFQFALLSLTLMMALTVFVGHGVYLLGASLIGLVCLLIDGMIFRSMAADYRARRRRAENAVVRERIDRCLRQYDTVLGYVESVARRRHDIRNQLSVVSALAERGDLDGARRYLDALERTLSVDGGRR